MRIMFVILVFILAYSSTSSLAVCQRFDEQTFEQLREQLRAEYAKSPNTALASVKKLLAEDGFELQQKLVLLNYKAWFLLDLNELEQTSATLVEYKNAADKLGEARFIYGYNNISGGLHSRLENYESALEFYLTAQKQLNELEPALKYQLDNNIALVYLKLGRHKDAISLFENYIAHVENINEPLKLSMTLNSLGEAYLSAKRFEEARATVERAIVIQQKNNFDRYMAASYRLLGDIDREQNNLTSSLTHLLNAVELYNNLSIDDNAVIASFSLAKTYYALNKHAEAELLIKQSLEKAQTLKLFGLTSQIHQFAALIYEQSDQNNKALEHYKLFNEVNSAILLRQTRVNLAKALAETDMASKDLEIANNQLEISKLTKESELEEQKTKAFKTLAVTITVSLVIILIGALSAIKSIHKRNKKLQIALDELAQTQTKLIEAERMASLTALVSGMAHQLNTPIGTIVTASSLIGDMINQLDEQLASKTLTQTGLSQFVSTVKDTRHLIINNIQRLAKMVEEFKTLNVTLEQNQTITTFKLQKLLHDVTAGYHHFKNKKIRFHIDCDDSELHSNCTVLVDVLKSLIINSFDHGYKTQQQGDIFFAAKSVDNQVIINYRDNGCGIKTDHFKDIFTPFYSSNPGGNHLGLGLNVVYNAIKHQLLGEIEVKQSDNGAHFVITLPLEIVPNNAGKTSN